jgi:hypothetical protein
LGFDTPVEVPGSIDISVDICAATAGPVRPPVRAISGLKARKSMDMPVGARLAFILLIGWLTSSAARPSGRAQQEQDDL